LLVGYYDGGGKQLTYGGKVGTGFSQETLHDLRQRLEKLEVDRSPFDKGEPPRMREVHWVRPRLVAEVAFGEWTNDGRLRHPRFEGLRPDKDPRECRREEPS
jgi:bifunctional non-homologous end joining protein LigD